MATAALQPTWCGKSREDGISCRINVICLLKCHKEDGYVFRATARVYDLFIKIAFEDLCIFEI